MKDGFPVSLAELLAAGERPLPSEAVAIVLDVCQQVMRQPAGGAVLPAISSAALFVDGSGAVAVAGGVPVEDDQTVPLLGRLLLQMLPAAGPGASRVPARLRLLATRAAAGEPPRLTVGGLVAALRRFGPEQPPLAIRGLFDRWRAGSAVAAGHRRETANLPPGPTEERRAAGPGRDVLRRMLREADEDAYLATLNASTDEADETPGSVEALETAADARAVGGPRSWKVARGRRRRMGKIGIVTVVLLVLGGMGAAYWLNADEVLPPLPVNPAIFISEPAPPPRGVWELLPDPAGLAVEAGPPAATGLEAHKTSGARSKPAEGEGMSKGRAQLDSPFAHRPEQRP